MSTPFMKQLEILINESDLVLEILDARFPKKTRNGQVEEKILRRGKKLVLVLNKTDLVSKQKILEEKKKLINEGQHRVVFVSAKEKNGVRLLKKEISIVKGKKDCCVVGMLGYPNAGKSTLINSLSGKKKRKVSVSKRAGHTRGLQKIKIGEGIYLLDAPGIIPYKEKDESELFLVGSKNANQLKDIEGVALKIISYLGIKEINTKLGVKGEDEEEVLEKFAEKKNWLIKGGKGDIKKAAREFLEMYQRNEL